LLSIGFFTSPDLIEINEGAPLSILRLPCSAMLFCGRCRGPTEVRPVQFVKTFQLYDFLDTLISLSVAFVFGTLIGAERQYRQRSAGLRTNVLVAVGAAAFVDLADHLNGAEGAVRVVAYVVSGIGFLGAGAIMKEGMNVRGLNTAATLWASAAVGSCAGADMIAQSAALTIFVLAGNTLLRPIVNAIDRIPLSEHSSEAVYEISVTTDAKRAAEVRDILNERLEAASYPVRESKIVFRSNDNVEVVAILVPLAVEPGELDAVVSDLSKLPGVSHATWSMSALE
jgi:putative Mg2+ transporter-C (MgtC) family protein